MTTGNDTRRSIGLLGGSFNPPHLGHRDISVAALDRIGLDAVWWLVTPGNPLKDPDDYAPFETRMRKAQLISDHPHIVISDFERRQKLQYTVHTIERLQLLNPDIAFVWLMGADSLASFDRWKDWRRITQNIPIAVFSRPGCEQSALESPAAIELEVFRHRPADAMALPQMEPPAWIYFDGLNNPSSSTAIRRATKNTPEAP